MISLGGFRGCEAELRAREVELVSFHQLALLRAPRFGFDLAYALSSRDERRDERHERRSVLLRVTSARGERVRLHAYVLESG